MEEIQSTIQSLTDHFNTQMSEFQKSLQGAIPATSPISNIAGQFSAFRAFVLSALAGLQKQVELLAKQTDQLEMRSRRKMLLVHGIPESNTSNLTAAVSTCISGHLKLPDIHEESFSRCQRLGKLKTDKPRAILVKFRDLSTRNKVWFAKTSLKNTGITLSEFLTKDRHDAFVSARQKFGISRCWTRDGLIVINGRDGKRHRVTSKAEINSIDWPSETRELASTVVASSSKGNIQMAKVVKPVVNELQKAKRAVRK